MLSRPSQTMKEEDPQWMYIIVLCFRATCSRKLNIKSKKRLAYTSSWPGGVCLHPSLHTRVVNLCCVRLSVLSHNASGGTISSRFRRNRMPLLLPVLLYSAGNIPAELPHQCSDLYSKGQSPWTLCMRPWDLDNLWSGGIAIAGMQRNLSRTMLHYQTVPCCNPDNCV